MKRDALAFAALWAAVLAVAVLVCRREARAAAPPQRGGSCVVTHVLNDSISVFVTVPR